MPENNLTDNFSEWVRDQLKHYSADVKEELSDLPEKKSISITAKLKLKHIAKGVFKPFYSISIPRAAVKAEEQPDQQLQLPGM